MLAEDLKYNKKIRSPAPAQAITQYMHLGDPTRTEFIYWPL